MPINRAFHRPLSDQTSCHAVYEGGYCPVGVTFEERTELLAHHREDFCALVDKTLKRHFEVIKRLVARVPISLTMGTPS